METTLSNATCLPPQSPINLYAEIVWCAAVVILDVGMLWLIFCSTRTRASRYDHLECPTAGNKEPGRTPIFKHEPDIIDPIQSTRS